jgi:hypothetical protein
MKKILIAASASILFVACQQPAGTASMQTGNPDTVGLAAFQSMKQQQDLAEFQAWKQVQAERQYNAYNAYAVTPAVAQPRTVVRYVPVRSTRTVERRYAATEPVVYTSESSNAARSRSRVSKAAKGAVIGGVVGAGAGAVINKQNRSKGAIIGGVIGAVGGYGIGRGMDKRDGRY